MEEDVPIAKAFLSNPKRALNRPGCEFEISFNFAPIDSCLEQDLFLLIISAMKGSREKNEFSFRKRERDSKLFERNRS